MIRAKSAALRTVVWDTFTCTRFPSCSTPNQDTHWTEVVIWGKKRSPVVAASSSFSLNLSNRYAALSRWSLCPPLWCLSNFSALLFTPGSDELPIDPTASLHLSTLACPPLVAGSNQKPVDHTTDPRRLTSRPTSSSARHWILQEAVQRPSEDVDRKSFLQGWYRRCSISQC